VRNLEKPMASVKYQLRSFGKYKYCIGQKISFANYRSYVKDVQMG
jgi:hypothetical protein